MKKVRRINGSSRQDDFMGSDFTYEDISDNTLHQIISAGISYDTRSASLPETSIKNSEVALKLSGYWKWGDASLYGFYGWDRLPTGYVLTSASAMFMPPPLQPPVPFSGTPFPLAGVTLGLHLSF